MSEEKKQNELPPAEAVGLGGLCEYAPGAVVSRTLYKNKAGTVTLFSFEEGQGLSEHSAPFDALVQIVEGEAELTIGGKLVAARAGDLVLMPANIPHAVLARDRFKMLLTMIRG
jgi:quercetin dioxygenase-like cupin family protein